ncbi:MAG: hypothetical protein QF652_06465 [Dehalococcoidia bacterium]|nr:hypothetical protein [Dehalococcoidia bacterium]
MSNEEAELARLHGEWFEAERVRRTLLDEFVSVGWVDPGLPIPDPPRILDDEGIEQLQESERRTTRARERYNDALKLQLGDE